MNERAARRLVLMGLVVMITVSGCGRVKEAAQLARSVADMAEAGKKAAETSVRAEGSSIDWENYDLKETDVRRFY